MSTEHASPSPREGARFTLLQVVVGGFALAGAAATATWTIRNDRLEQLQSTVAAYETTKSWGLPEAINSINTASARLAKQLGTASEIDGLRTSETKLRRQVADLSARASQLEVAIKDRDEELARVYPELKTFTLKERESTNFGAYSVVVGLSDVLSDRVEVTVGNRELTLKPGAYADVTVRNLPCKLVLDTFYYSGSPETATFSLVCTAASTRKAG